MAYILGLDDHELMSSILEMCLQQAGYTAVYVSDSFEAWAWLHTFRFDLFIQSTHSDIFIQYEWPDAGGVQVDLKVKADPDLSGMPILLMSANLEVVQAASKIDGVSALAKPFEIPDLLTILYTLVGAPEAPPLPSPADHTWELLHTTHTETLLAALQSDAWTARWPAVLTLGRLQVAEARQPLLCILQTDDNPYVRMMAIYALGVWAEEPEVKEARARAKQDPIMWIRYAAKHAPKRSSL